MLSSRLVPASLSALLIASALSLSSVQPADAADATVEIVGFTFSPADVTIDAGESVTWVNPSGEIHSTTNGAGFEDPEWGTLWSYWFFNGEGESFTYQFTSPGVYPYFCIPHFDLGMTGVVRVMAPSAVEPKTWGAIKGLYR
jgi:plastocyanin